MSIPKKIPLLTLTLTLSPAYRQAGVKGEDKSFNWI